MQQSTEVDIMDSLSSFEVNERVDVNRRTYLVSGVYYPRDRCIVELKRVTDGTTCWIGGGKLWTLSLNGKLKMHREYLPA